MTLYPYADDFGMICDNLADGGGASTGIKAAMCRLKPLAKARRRHLSGNIVQRAKLLDCRSDMLGSFITVYEKHFPIAAVRRIDEIISIPGNADRADRLIDALADQRLLCLALYHQLQLLNADQLALVAHGYVVPFLCGTSMSLLRQDGKNHCDNGAQGLPITKTAHVAQGGNSVCPPIAEALVRAQFPAECVQSDEQVAA